MIGPVLELVVDDGTTGDDDGGETTGDDDDDVVVVEVVDEGGATTDDDDDVVLVVVAGGLVATQAHTELAALRAWRRELMSLQADDTQASAVARMALEDAVLHWPVMPLTETPGMEFNTALTVKVRRIRASDDRRCRLHTGGLRVLVSNTLPRLYSI